MKRKHFLQQAGMVTLGTAILPKQTLARTPDAKQLFEVDYAALLARAAIRYSRPSASNDEGLPIGNGQMGTLVWTEKVGTTDGAKIMYQLNRNDTFGMDRTHKHCDPKILSGQNVETTDNALSLCRIGIGVEQASFQSQIQNTAEGTVSFQYKGDAGLVDIVTFISAKDDIMVTKIDDGRARPAGFIFEVSMVRRPHEVNGENLRDYTITETNGQVLIVQTVTEGAFFMQYAVALCVQGTKVQVLEKNADYIRFRTEPFTGAFDFFLTSAATLYEKADVSAKALALLSKARSHGSLALLNAHRDWWRQFWESGRTFIHLSSDDGVADYLEAGYNLHLYHMASTARGNFPPLYNYGLWFSRISGERPWGAQYKFMNDMMMYLPLYAANHMALTDAYLGMYRRMLPDCEIAAQQRWGVGKGAYVPETVGPSGPVLLSEKAAPMVHEVLMGKRTRASLPPEVIEECLAETTLDWINPKYGSVRNDHFSYLSHILSSGAQLAMQFYWRYKMTGDINWLRESAYPMMKGMVDFYQDYARKGGDGCFHIFPANVHESYWGVKDGIVDLGAIRSLTPKVIACSEMLGVDADRRKGWRELVEKIAAYPAGNDPGVVQLQSPGTGQSPRGESIPLFPSGTFGAGYALSCVGRQNVDPVWMWPVFPFEDISLVRGRFTGTPEEKENFQKMLLTYANLPPTFYGFPWPPYASRLGLTDEVRKLIPLYVATIQQTPNGLQRSWGQANLGLSAEALQSALMQSVDDTIIIAPAWPSEWQADFTLLARGGFLVSASLEKGAPRCVQIESTFGKTCRLINPWFPAPAFLIAAGKPPRKSEKQIIEFTLEPGESVLLAGDLAGIPQLPVKIKPDPGPAVKTLEVINAKGQPVKRQLGKA
ncbi:MAG: hypothetical protein J7539_15690 [Niabella sp.]|nr:hypothetical protein [Niabella sp.]